MTDMDDGIEAFNKGDTDGAKVKFNKVLQAEPENAKAWYYLGLSTTDPREVYWQKQDHDQSIKYFRKAVELDPSFVDALALEGWTLACLGNPEEGLKSVNKAIEINSTSDLAWNFKGCILYLLGDLDGALNCFEKAIEYNPAWVDPLANKGYVLEDLGRKTEAAEILKQSEKLEVREF